jgi:hypothetical protein
VYGFIIGAWPLGIAQIVYAVLAYRTWLKSRRSTQSVIRQVRQHRFANESFEESRMSRLFGSN